MHNAILATGRSDQEEGQLTLEAVDTREVILRTALELFTKQGFEKTSISEIADSLSITKAGVYYHFKAKDELLTTLVNPFLDAVDQVLAVATAERGSLKNDELMRAYLDAFIKHRAILAFLSSDVSALNHPRIGIRARGHNARFTRLLAGSRASIADQILVSSALGALQFPVLLFPDIDIGRHRNAIVDAASGILSGLGRSADSKQKRLSRSSRESD